MKNIGESFTYNFLTAAVLSKGNIAKGVSTGGSFALATAVSNVVKPYFMAMLGYQPYSAPPLAARFAENMVVLSIHAALIGNFQIAAIHWLATGILALLNALLEEGSLVKDEQVFYKFETLLIKQGLEFAKRFL